MIPTFSRLSSGTLTPEPLKALRHAQTEELEVRQLPLHSVGVQQALITADYAL